MISALVDHVDGNQSCPDSSGSQFCAKTVLIRVSNTVSIHTQSRNKFSSNFNPHF